MLGVAPWTVARWSDSGELWRTFTRGGHRRYDRDEVRALADRLKGREVTALLSWASSSRPERLCSCGSRLDSIAWHIREAREERRLRAELEALRRIYDKGDNL